MAQKWPHLWKKKYKNPFSFSRCEKYNTTKKKYYIFLFFASIPHFLRQRKNPAKILQKSCNNPAKILQSVFTISQKISCGKYFFCQITSWYIYFSNPLSKGSVFSKETMVIAISAKYWTKSLSISIFLLHRNYGQWFQSVLWRFDHSTTNKT